MKKAARPKGVDEYLAGVPKEARGKLKELRAAIKEAAPKAIEKISYGMPYYDHKGRLAYFRLANGYIGLYIPSPVIEEYKKETKKYATSMATLHLPLEGKLPVSLIKRLIKTRMKKNEERKERGR